MATWVTHMIIADRVLQALPGLDRLAFCVGNIAPDCNVENADWTAFIPSREVTHWMSANRKAAADSERFYREYVQPREARITQQERLFLLGYYAHLVVDAEFQRCIRAADRVAAVWSRIKAHPVLAGQAEGLPETWDTVKRLIPKDQRMRDIYTIEAEYLDANPKSGYFEVMKLKAFPDYVDYLPTGAILRKIGVMGYWPRKETGAHPFVAMSREEYDAFMDEATRLVLAGIEDK